ncbi:MAG TPA: PIG-L deacetylase family protein [Acidimicrobiia bacterium]|nr:PIG-L deacetylase family protein [Acidimicrobiia bacterium]
MLDATVPESALAVYAHPDDPEISAGGTLAAWAAGGCRVHVVVTTLGDKGSSDPTVDPVALGARRRGEAEAAAAMLGVAEVHHLGFPDGDLPDDAELRRRICELVRRVRPEVVLCPDPTAVFFGDQYFNHRDHRITGWATLDAVAPAATNPHYFPEQLAAGLAVHRVRAVYLSGTLDPTVWVDVTDTQERKVDALFCHESQLAETGEWFREFLRERAEAEGRRAGVRYAEGFRRLVLG